MHVLFTRGVEDCASMRGVQLKLKSNPVDLMSPKIRLCENRPHVNHVNNTHVLEVITRPVVQHHLRSAATKDDCTSNTERVFNVGD